MAVRWRPSKGAIGNSRDQGPVAPSSTTDPYRDDDDDRTSRPLILNPEYAQTHCSVQHPERTTFLIGPAADQAGVEPPDLEPLSQSPCKCPDSIDQPKIKFWLNVKNLAVLTHLD